MVALQNSDIVHSKLTREMGSNDVPVGKLDLEDRVGKYLNDLAFKFDNVILRQNNPSYAMISSCIACRCFKSCQISVQHTVC